MTQASPIPLDEKALEAAIAQVTLIHSLANDINERNYADKRLYLLQAIVRLSDELAALSSKPSDGWIATSDRLPAKPDQTRYEHVDCLIVYRGQVLRRPWNCEHLCWDDEEGDDFFCDATAPTHWRPLPKPPVTP